MSGPRCFERNAPRVIDNGFPALLPCKGKRPLPVEWQRWNSEPVTEAELAEWCRRWPWANVGLPAGHGLWWLDCDVLEAALAEWLARLADDVLGASPAVRIGRAPKWARLYRGRVASRKAHPIEVFGDSGQVLAFGRHPDTGRAYYWPDESPLSLTPDDLPAVSAEALDAFLEGALARVERRRPSGGAAPEAFDTFAALRAERQGKRGREWVAVLERQLADAQPGELHNVLVSVVAALVSAGYSDTACAAFVERHFAAPREGQYAEVWNQLDDALAGARRKWTPRGRSVRLVLEVQT